MTFTRALVAVASVLIIAGVFVVLSGHEQHNSSEPASTELVASEPACTELVDSLCKDQWVFGITDNADDCLALVDFYKATGCKISGFATKGNSMCDWTGVTCDSTSHRVIKLQLERVNGPGNLHGPIPDSFGKLSALQSLDLYGNGLTSIPASMGSLSALTYLNLGDNYFKGTLPDLSKLSALQELMLGFNAFDGLIPDWLGSLTALKSLNLGNQRGQFDVTGRIMLSQGFTGPIPESFGKLSALETLNLGNPGVMNPLTGTLPAALGKLSALKTLDVDGHAFTGTIPDSFSSLSALAYLDVSASQKPGISGTIPDWLSKRSALTHLYMDGNTFSGTIPGWLGSLSALQELDLENNLFAGAVPDSLSKLSALQRLNLSSNKLSSFPKHSKVCNLLRTGPLWFQQSRTLDDCSLSNNDFACPLPACAQTANAEGITCSATCK